LPLPGTVVLVGAEPTMSTLPSCSTSRLFRAPFAAFALHVPPSGAQSRQGNASQLEGFGRQPFKLVVLELMLLFVASSSGDPARAAVSADRCGIAVACTTRRLCHLLRDHCESFQNHDMTVELRGKLIVYWVTCVPRASNPTCESHNCFLCSSYLLRYNICTAI
jgi:hypothetical protein